MKRRILIGVTLSAIMVCAEAQTPRYPTNLSRERLASQLKKELRESGFPSHQLILALGASKDPRFIPLLKRLARGDHLSEDRQPWAAQMALAKLDHKQELSEIQCEVKQMSHKEARYYAITEKLPYVGGWFAIRLIADLLRETPENKDNLGWGDQLLENSQTLAFRLIPSLVPRPITESRDRFGTTDGESEQVRGLDEKQVIKGWHDWIMDHQKELEGLQPTGAEVEYSEIGCTKYLQRQVREVERATPPYK